MCAVAKNRQSKGVAFAMIDETVDRFHRSVVPGLFWWFSIGGGICLLIYAILRRDIVIFVGDWGHDPWTRDFPGQLAETYDPETESWSVSDLGFNNDTYSGIEVWRDGSLLATVDGKAQGLQNTG